MAVENFFTLKKERAEKLSYLAKKHKYEALSDAEVKYLKESVNAAYTVYDTLANSLISKNKSRDLRPGEIRDIFDMIKAYFPNFLEKDFFWNERTTITGRKVNKPLDEAILGNDAEMVDMLLDMGVEVSIENFKTSIFLCKTEAFKALLAKRLDIAKDYCIAHPNNNLLHYATDGLPRNKAEIVELLIDNVYQNNDTLDLDSIGGLCDRTPLQYAIMYKRTELAKVLIVKGANPNVINYRGESVLFETIKIYGDEGFEIAKLLLEHGASTSLATSEDEGFKTPLHIACENKSYKIAKLLLENGADKEAKDIDGKIPFDYLEKGELAIVLQEPVQESFTGKITECFYNIYDALKAPMLEEVPMDSSNSDDQTVHHTLAFL